MDIFTSSKTRFLIRAGQRSRNSHSVAPQSGLRFLDSTLEAEKKKTQRSLVQAKCLSQCLILYTPSLSV